MHLWVERNFLIPFFSPKENLFLIVLLRGLCYISSSVPQTPGYVLLCIRKDFQLNSIFGFIPASFPCLFIGEIEDV